MRVLKICSFICAIIVMTSCDSAEVPEETGDSRIVMKCANEVGVSREIAETILRNNFTVPDETNENQRCYVHCIGLTLGYITSEGVLNVDAMFKEADKFLKDREQPRTTLREEIEECAKKTGSGKCMTSYVNIICLAGTVS
ncbi:uncharacterized protein LOC126100864 [Schistocerca cancellata]|uniref:uncharacterized protein LOC126100864 n=1 Tax=Schistocerca cancellata TaxID=274614 RepID=UPI0021187F77|nr:uncharacterized protein LOC126100864 [Schistocerca cancellata]